MGIGKVARLNRADKGSKRYLWCWGSLRSTSTGALEAIIRLSPLDLNYKGVAAANVVRLGETNSAESELSTTQHIGNCCLSGQCYPSVFRRSCFVKR